MSKFERDLYTFNRKENIFYVRLTVTIVISYMLLFSNTPLAYQNLSYLFLAFYLATNFFLYRLPESIFYKKSFFYVLASFDTAMIVLGIFLSGHASPYFFLVYFFILGFASMSMNLRYLMVNVFLFIIIYGWLLHINGEFVGDKFTPNMLKLPFILTVALLFGYIIQCVIYDINKNFRISSYVLRSSLSAIALAELSGKIIYVNSSLLKMWGYENESPILDMHVRDLFRQGKDTEKIWREIKSFQGLDGEYIVRKNDDSLIEVKLLVSTVRDDKEKPLCFMLSFIDITQQKLAERNLHEANRNMEKKVQLRTKELAMSNAQLQREVEERKKYEQALRSSERKYRLLAENMFDVIWKAEFASDNILKYKYLSPSTVNLLGYLPEELIDCPFEKCLTSESCQKLKRTLDQVGTTTKNQQDPKSISLEVEQIHKDGKIIWTEVIATLFWSEEGNLLSAQGVTRDITKRKEMEEKLREQSFHDTLTGLYNRAFFEKEMHRLQDGRYCPVGILICDIDGLKLVNDTFGHSKGDQIIKETAELLRDYFRKSDILARVGGDEFAVLLPKVTENDMKEICQRIKHRLEENMSKAPELPLTVSMGYAVSYSTPVDMETLFKEADGNMYKEKMYRSQSVRSEIINALTKIMEVRDFITEGHGERMQDLVVNMAEFLDFSTSKINDLKLLAQFHDIGKVGIPDHILFKSEKLNQEEFKEMQGHCEIGYRIAKTAPHLFHIADFILKHHEWWNGQGYPLGLQGEEIPLECRILAIVDAYDTMTSNRPYSRAVSHEEAEKELKRWSGIQFDPYLVEHFLYLIGEARYIKSSADKNA